MSNIQECPNCGSTFFTSVRAEQFISGGYGSAEFRSISNAPKTAYQCVGCGTSIGQKQQFFSRGTTADVVEQEFRKSMEAGTKYRKELSVKQDMSNFVSTDELQKVIDMIEDIKKIISNQNKLNMPQLKASPESKELKVLPGASK